MADAIAAQAAQQATAPAAVDQAQANQSANEGAAATATQSTGAAAEQQPKRADAIALIARAKRLEAQARAERAAIRAEQQRLENQRGQYESLQQAAQRYEQLRQRAAEKPSEALKELGLDVRRVNEDIINDGKRSPEDIVRSELANFEKRLEQKAAEQQRAAQQQWQEQQSAQTLAQAKAQLRSIAEAEPEKYSELIASETYDRAWKYVEEYYEKTRKVMVRKTGNPNAQGMVLDFKEALEAEEKYLRDRRASLAPKPKTDKLSKPAEQIRTKTQLSEKLLASLSKAERRSVGAVGSRNAQDAGREVQQPANPQLKGRKTFNYNRHAAALRQQLAIQRDQ